MWVIQGVALDTGTYDLAHLPASWWLDVYAFCAADAADSCKGGKAISSIHANCGACLHGSLTVAMDRQATLCLAAPAPSPSCVGCMIDPLILGSIALYSGPVHLDEH